MNREAPVPSVSASALRATPVSGAWWAFRAGLARMLGAWLLLLLFYAVLALLSGLLLLPAGRALSGWVGHRLAAGEVAAGLPGWLAAEAVGDIIERGENIQATAGWVPLVLLSLPAWPFFLALPATVLSAGALPVYVAGAGGSGWRRFGRGLARYTFSFLLLLFLEVTFYELALLATILLAALVVALSKSLWSILLAVPLLALVVVFLPWWFEYARTVAAVEDRRDVLQVLGRSVSFLWHNLGPAALLALYHFLLLLLPYLLWLLLGRLVPPTWWVGHTVLQQALVLALLGARLARMAGQAAFLQLRLPAAGATSVMIAT